MKSGKGRMEMERPFTLLLFFLIHFLHFNLVASSTPPFSCSPPANGFGFCDTTRSITDRVDDLIGRLTLEEKINQLGDVTSPIPRFGIPGYKWWSESLHGVSDSGKGIHFDGVIKSATSFPQVILTAASFNPLLWYRIGEAIGTEARAIYNAGQAEGMTFWSPNINIYRDPRWGRGQETPGEDPETVSKYAVSYVRGLQGDTYEGGRSPALKVSACCKHFTAYDLDNWKGVERYTFNAKVSAQDLEDTFMPPFKSCVEEGHASGMMCSYNQLNGVPTCADYDLLSKTARQEWGFNGYITSDCDAVSIIHDAQGYAKTPEDAVADVLKAGMDVNCGKYVQNYTASAIRLGKVKESDVNRALGNLFTIRMRLGLFNGNPKNLPYGNIMPSAVCTQEHQDLALEAALDGIVLLKNTDDLLPWSQSGVKSLAMIGPNANNGSTILGNYAGPPCKSETPLQALENYVKDIRYISGCDSVACTTSSVGDAVELAKSVDYVMMFMGLDQTQEREDHDRIDLVLPGRQQELITSVARVSRRPIVLVLMCGGPVDVKFAMLDRKIGGILWVGYPGEAGGSAIAKVLFGEHNPGGRLPVTWYPQEFTRVPMTDMRMRPDPAIGYPGRTYRFYTGETVFKFGYGLSYSRFTYNFIASSNPHTIYLNESLKVSGLASYDTAKLGHQVCTAMSFFVAVAAKNEGSRAGRHPVLLYTELAGGSPEKLVGFESVWLEGGGEERVLFGVNPCEHLSRVEEDGRRVMDVGAHMLMVGDAKYEVDVIA